MSDEEPDEEKNFDSIEHLFGGEGMADAAEIAFEAMAQIMAPVYRALKRQGLSAQESAALTAAFVAQNMPVDLQGPQDGS